MLATKTATKTAQDGIWEPEPAQTPKMVPKMTPPTPQNDAPDTPFWIDFGIILEYVLMNHSLLFSLVCDQFQCR